MESQVVPAEETARQHCGPELSNDPAYNEVVPCVSCNISSPAARQETLRLTSQDVLLIGRGPDERRRLFLNVDILFGQLCKVSSIRVYASTSGSYTLLGCFACHRTSRD